MEKTSCFHLHPSPAFLALVFIFSSALLRSSNAQVINSRINFEVQEEQNAPIRLGNIAEEANIDGKPNLQLSINSKVNYNQDLFELDTATGDFSTAIRLDRESLCGSVPRCVMTTLVVASTPEFFTRLTVNVTIRDANDQGPEFKEDSFPISISERSPINSTFQLPVAHDADVEPAFGVKGYRLKKPVSQSVFDVVQNLQSSERELVHLRLRESLDREFESNVRLTLVAYDGGSPPNEAELSIDITVLDANDNAPQFSTENNDDIYRFSIPETHPVNTPIHTLVATDKDEGENARVGFEYPIDTLPRMRDLFDIGKSTGKITLIKSLDKEGGNTIAFKVSAFDYGSPSESSEAEVIIEIMDTVNDPPSIRISPWKNDNGKAVVSEQAAFGAKVAFVDVEDTDSDSGDIFCNVKSDFFDMQPYTTPGAYTISVAAKLDRESSSEHSVIIRCSDQGSPSKTSTEALTVIVEDYNDNVPVFTKDVYRMSVKENQDVDKRVGVVSASDLDVGPNGELRYSVDSKITEFSIDEVSGMIKTAVRNLDREATSSYTFDVYAADMSDTPITATATVVVVIEDMNDEWPLFDKASYQFNVSEKTDANRIIGVVHASDRDLGASGTVKYLMVPSPADPDAPFSVNRQDGSIVLTTALDYESKKRYSFVITAVDLGRPPRNSSIKISIEVVDENDNSPVIEFPSPDNLSVTLNLDVTPGHEVVKVSAYDPDSGDNGRLSYSIVGPNTTSASNLFWINEDTGLVTLLTTLTKDDVRSYNVIISVRDNGIQQRATQAILKVDIVRIADQSSSSHTNMTIVIIMVCVTLFVAIIVLTTLCFIKYTDKRNFYSHKDAPAKNDLHSSSQGGKTATTMTYSDASSDRRAGGDVFFDTVLENSPTLQQKQPLSSSSSTSSSSRYNKSTKGTIINPNTNTSVPSAITLKNGKKSVTFDDDDVISRSGNGSMTPDIINPHNDSIFLESGGVSTFKPGSCPALYNIKPPNPHLHHNSHSPHHHLPHSPHHIQQQQHLPPPTSSSLSFALDSSSTQQLLLDNSMNASARTGTGSPHPALQPTSSSSSNSNSGGAGGGNNNSSSSSNKDPHHPHHHPHPHQDGDQVIDVALHNHHALVRSMRGRRNGGSARQAAARAPSNRDNTDICSSSSVETSDSGHGSELDVSVVKATV